MKGWCVTCHFQVNRSKVQVTWMIWICVCVCVWGGNWTTIHRTTISSYIDLDTIINIFMHIFVLYRYLYSGIHMCMLYIHTLIVACIHVYGKLHVYLYCKLTLCYLIVLCLISIQYLNFLDEYESWSMMLICENDFIKMIGLYFMVTGIIQW